jgi:hypothetical protein
MQTLSRRHFLAAAANAGLLAQRLSKQAADESRR